MTHRPDAPTRRPSPGAPPPAPPPASEMDVQAELRARATSVRIARFRLSDPVDNVMAPAAGYRLNLCLTPRPAGARGCFPARWGPHRFEPLGDVFLVPPGEALRTRSAGGRQASVICEIEVGAVERWTGGAFDWNDRRLAASLDVVDPHVRTLLGRLAEEAHRPGLATEALVELIAGQLAIEVARYLLAVSDGPAAGGLAAWRLRVIDERLRDLRHPPALAELAAACTLSVRQLTRGFRASRGVTVADHIARLRIEGAKRLLSGQDSIKAIAYATGFASPSSFAHAFRQATGISPRQFRARMNGPAG